MIGSGMPGTQQTVQSRPHLTPMGNVMLYIFKLYLFFFETVYLMSPRLASEKLVDKDKLEFSDPPPSTSQVLVLQVCATISGLLVLLEIQPRVHAEQVFYSLGHIPSQNYILTVVFFV